MTALASTENGSSSMEQPQLSSDKGPSGNAEAAPSDPNVSSSVPAAVGPAKRTKAVFKYDPKKITLRFLFANRDGLSVNVEFNPSDTVSEVKAALLSAWPEALPTCTDGQRIRLICMGKGVLMPDTRSLEECQVPVFKSHPTPINVSVRPENVDVGISKDGNEGKSARGGGGGSGTPGGGQPASSRSNSGGGGGGGGTNNEADQGCACMIM